MPSRALRGLEFDNAGAAWAPVPSGSRRRSRSRSRAASSSSSPARRRKSSSPAAAAKGDPPASSNLPYLGCVVVLLLLLALAATPESSAQAWNVAYACSAAWKSLMDRAEAVVKEMGPWWAALYFLGLYTVSSIFCLPLFGFHAIAGYTYGTARCVALVTVCQTFGAATAFLFARYFIRPSVESFLRRRFGESFVAMDEAIAKQGFKIVFLIRASPVLPFSVTNYLCGCSLSLDLISFVLATWVGVLPGTTSYCSIGYAGKAVTSEEGKTTMQKYLLGFGVLAALLMVKTISDMATRTLAEAGVTGSKGDSAKRNKSKKKA